MKVWGISPLEIEREWTDDFYYMMIERLSERIADENKDTKKGGRRNSKGAGSTGGDQRKSYSTSDFLKMAPQKKQASGA
jgi:hypothetical protein